MPENKTDKEILKLCTTNVNQGFSLLMQTYQERLYWHIRHMVLLHDDTNDILQNTLIKVFKGLPKFRKDAALYTWLYTIATNETLNFIKQKKKRNLISSEEQLNIWQETLSADAYFDGDEAQKKLQLAILQLPEKQRLVFNMKYFQEMKYEDMAGILNQSVGGLKANYHHAVKKIETLLKQSID